MPFSSLVVIGAASLLLVVLMILRAREGAGKPKAAGPAVPRHRPVPCPKCHSEERVIPVVYGPPRLDTLRMARERKIHLGGSLAIDNGPDCHCLACCYTFFSVLNDQPITARR